MDDKNHTWLDKYITAQEEQRKALNRVCAPYTAAELVELIEVFEETNELPSDSDGTFDMFPNESAYGPADLVAEIGDAVYDEWQAHDGMSVCVEPAGPENYLNFIFSDGYIIDAISDVHFCPQDEQ